MPLADLVAGAVVQHPSRIQRVGVGVVINRGINIACHFVSLSSCPEQARLSRVIIHGLPPFDAARVAGGPRLGSPRAARTRN